ncbi:helix-turn-helix domain-containing protein [Streptomyces sp. NPDC057686]|uniref:helix-turn-helix domain-containing protein n=1 Tax=Streptomyces sp. NPDC057686 TaxID=3346212 RepID=UPI00368FD0AE
MRGESVHGIARARGPPPGGEGPGQVGLFRCSLIQDLLDQSLTTRERRRLAREVAEQEHTDPFGQLVKVSRGSIDRWTGHYRIGRFAALVPEPRKAVPRTRLPWERTIGYRPWRQSCLTVSCIHVVRRLPSCPACGRPPAATRSVV